MEIQPAAIIYFNDNSPIAREHAAIIQSMVREAGSNFKLSIKEYELAKEEDLAGQVEAVVVAAPVEDRLADVLRQYGPQRGAVRGAGAGLR